MARVSHNSRIHPSFAFPLIMSDEKSSCVAICDRFGLKGYQKFAFVEMRSVEEASNAMALDGIIFKVLKPMLSLTSSNDGMLPGEGTRPPLTSTNASFFGDMHAEVNTSHIQRLNDTSKGNIYT
ncbi:hypothetical protein L6452_35283 [Arctium lappa]|uniref:Uncharacterized protein n=1 Tax=Arctium lappa TaxID=4217 RepID=A0ACB8Y7H8_ARCLA|nr:hypothetical protein L6452_35283 [Arctium lappa]